MKKIMFATFIAALVTMSSSDLSGDCSGGLCGGDSFGYASDRGVGAGGRMSDERYWKHYYHPWRQYASYRPSSPSIEYGVGTDDWYNRIHRHYYW